MVARRSTVSLPVSMEGFATDFPEDGKVYTGEVKFFDPTKVRSTVLFLLVFYVDPVIRWKILCVYLVANDGSNPFELARSHLKSAQWRIELL